jgi:hypothetical protein
VLSSTASGQLQSQHEYKQQKQDNTGNDKYEKETNNDNNNNHNNNTRRKEIVYGGVEYIQLAHCRAQDWLL